MRDLFDSFPWAPWIALALLVTWDRWQRRRERLARDARDARGREEREAADFARWAAAHPHLVALHREVGPTAAAMLAATVPDDVLRRAWAETRAKGARR